MAQGSSSSTKLDKLVFQPKMRNHEHQGIHNEDYPAIGNTMRPHFDIRNEKATPTSGQCERMKNGWKTSVR